MDHVENVKTWLSCAMEGKALPPLDQAAFEGIGMSLKRYFHSEADQTTLAKETCQIGVFALQLLLARLQATIDAQREASAQQHLN